MIQINQKRCGDLSHAEIFTVFVGTSRTSLPNLL